MFVWECQSIVDGGHLRGDVSAGRYDLELFDERLDIRLFGVRLERPERDFEAHAAVDLQVIAQRGSGL